MYYPEDVKKIFENAKKNGDAGVLRIVYIPHDLTKDFSQGYYPVSDAQDFQNDARKTFLQMLALRNSQFDRSNQLTINDFSVKRTNTNYGLDEITYTRK